MRLYYISLLALVLCLEHCSFSQENKAEEVPTDLLTEEQKRDIPKKYWKDFCVLSKMDRELVWLSFYLKRERVLKIMNVFSIIIPPCIILFIYGVSLLSHFLGFFDKQTTQWGLVGISALYVGYTCWYYVHTRLKDIKKDSEHALEYNLIRAEGLNKARRKAWIDSLYKSVSLEETA